MKPLIRPAVVLSLLLTSFFASAELRAEGGKGGNAGALVERNGEVLTFKSAGISVKLDEPLDISEIPETIEIDQDFASIQMPKRVRDRLNQAIRPRDSRRYYRLDRISAQDWARIEALYRKALGNTSEKLVLAAITSGSDTYLLPAYFKIKNINSKKAILVHEAAWWLKPNSDYKTVVRSEIEFEKCLDKPLLRLDWNDSKLNQRICADWLVAMSEPLGEPNLPMQQYAAEDYALGRFDRKWFKDGALEAHVFFGVPALALGEKDTSSRSELFNAWYNYIFEQSLKNSDSRFLKYVAYYAEEMGVNISYLKEIFSDYRQDGSYRELRFATLILVRKDVGFRPWNDETLEGLHPLVLPREMNSGGLRDVFLDGNLIRFRFGRTKKSH